MIFIYTIPLISLFEFDYRALVMVVSTWTKSKNWQFWILKCMKTHKDNFFVTVGGELLNTQNLDN
jgi:hypothetical protein